MSTPGEIPQVEGVEADEQRAAEAGAQTLRVRDSQVKCDYCGTFCAALSGRCSACGALLESAGARGEGLVLRASTGTRREHCGTFIPPLSRDCTECGQAPNGLSSSGEGFVLRASSRARCPNCGTANPSSSGWCSKCGAPLKVASIAGPCPVVVVQPAPAPISRVEPANAQSIPGTRQEPGEATRRPEPTTRRPPSTLRVLPYRQYCQRCGALEAVYPVKFQSNIGLVVLRFHQRVEGNLCWKCVRAEHNSHTITNLLLGWWGIKSFFATIIYLSQNSTSFAEAKQYFESLE